MSIRCFLNDTILFHKKSIHMNDDVSAHYFCVFYYVFKVSTRSIDFFSDMLFVRRLIDKNDKRQDASTCPAYFFLLTKSIKFISIFCNSYQIEGWCSSTLRSQRTQLCYLVRYKSDDKLVWQTEWKIIILFYDTNCKSKWSQHFH